MSDIVCTTSLLDTPRFAIYFLTIISSIYFTCLCNINAHFLGGKELSYVIGLLPIFCKQLVAFCRGTGSSPNSKQAASHTPSTAGFLRISMHFFSLGQFYSFHQKNLFQFAAGSSNSLVTVAMSCSDALSAPDSMGTDSQ